MALPNVFTSGDVFTAANANLLRSNQYNRTTSTKTANYVLVAADVGTRVLMNAAGTTTITVNTSLFSAGDTLEISNIGAGVCTITSGTCTVTSSSSLALVQYASGTLFFTSASAAIFIASDVTASAGALTFINSVTVTGASSASINNCFSSTYANYLVTYSTTNTVSADLGVRLRVSTTDNTTTNYNAQQYYANVTGAAGGGNQNVTGNTYFTMNAGGGTRANDGAMWLFSPQLAVTTKASALQLVLDNGGPYYQQNTTCYFAAATQFDGISFIISSGNMTGTIRVYGVANS